MEWSEYNFNKCFSCNHHGLPYDTGSVMHYSPWAFSKNGQPTIQKIGCPDCLFGQRFGLSYTDLLGLKKLYSCEEQTPICEDNSEYAEQCPSLASKGYCKHPYAGPFMAFYCGKTCNSC